MKILVFGDFVPTQLNYDFCKNGDFSSLFGDELTAIIKQHDHILFNLEAPLYDGEKKIFKCGPNLKAPVECGTIIKKFNNPIVCMANNHIFDSGVEGLKSTLNFLNSSKIYHLGAGLNADDIEKPFILDNVCIFNYCEHEFSYDENLMCGANQFDEGKPYLQIKRAKEMCMFVIVVFHGGKEHFQYPSPNVRLKCQNLIESGADFVFCQHSHCVGAIEKYQNGTIFFGQGNFLFRKSEESAMWSQGIGVSIDTSNNSYEIIPFKSCGFGIALDKNIEYRINSIPKIDGFNKTQNVDIKDKYVKFADKNFLKYLCKLRGYSKIRMGIEIYIFKGLTLKLIYTRKKIKVIENIINCESHNELLITGLRNFKK